MRDVEGLEPGARRRALLVFAAAAVAGTVLFFVADRYGPSVRDWIVADPARSASRFRMVLLVLGLLLTAPLAGFAAFMWSAASRMAMAEVGSSRSRTVKALAVALLLCCALLLVVLWRLGSTLRM